MADKKKRTPRMGHTTSLTRKVYADGEKKYIMSFMGRYTKDEADNRKRDAERRQLEYDKEEAKKRLAKKLGKLYNKTVGK